MGQLESKYLPEQVLQISTVEVQIAEAKNIAFRLSLEVREAKEAGEKNKVQEAEINIERMKAKIDLLQKVLEELQA